MMKEFLVLNRDKLKFGLKWISIIFTSIVLIAFAWGRFYGQVPEWTLFITVLLVAGIFFPIFIMSIGTIKEFQVYKRTKAILDNYPFNELTKNGFQKSHTFENSKWTMTQLMLKGQFDNYPIECEVENSTFKFIALTNLDNVKKEHMKKLKKEFGDSKIEFDWFGIAMKYNTTKDRVTSFDQLKTDLGRFIGFLRDEKLDPWDNEKNGSA